MACALRSFLPSMRLSLESQAVDFIPGTESETGEKSRTPESDRR